MLFIMTHIHIRLLLLLLAGWTSAALIGPRAGSFNATTRIFGNSSANDGGPDSNGDTTQLFHTESFANVSLSKPCLTALVAPIACNATIRDSSFLYTWGGLSAGDLAGLCTLRCNASLTTYRTAVATACANDLYTDPVTNSSGYAYGTQQPVSIYDSEGVTMRPIGLVDFYALNYALLCMVDDKTHQLCYTLTADGAPGAADECSSCALDSFRLQVEDARLYDTDLAQSYSAALSSCHVTAPPIATPSPVFFPNNKYVFTRSNQSCAYLHLLVSLAY